MATVTQWTPFDVALDLTATVDTVTRQTATLCRVFIEVSWKTHWSGAQTNYGMIATSGGGSANLNTFGVKSSGRSGQIVATFNVPQNAATTKSITVTFRNFNDDNGKSATRSISLTVQVPAWRSYTVSYDANGGSGAPSAQTKWADQALTLSGTKPTRTGYSFQGWATSSGGSVTYAAGASYTANAGITLYAVWKALTYTISYNANGGTGAPGNQTKTYGVALTLSNTKPTRARYKFLGWGTSASATTIQYLAGDVYTANAAITLYAIWELAYQEPRIYNLSAIRYDNDGDVAEDGTRVLLSFDWASDRERVQTAISYRASSSNADVWYPVQELDATGGTSGNVQTWLSSIVWDSEITYDIRIHLADELDFTDVTITLPSTKYAVDVLAGGKGIAFGKTAEQDNTAEFAFDAKFNGPVYGRALGMDKLPEIPENSDFNEYMTTGCYAVYKNTIAESIANIPVVRAGRLEVWSSTGEGVRSEEYSYLRQRFVPYNKENAVWERDITRGSDNVWTYSDWWRSTLTPAASAHVYHEQKVLWSGEYYMSGSQTATLSEAVSAQANGIVLVFSRYSSGVSHNYHFNTFFIPKKQVELLPGYGHTFLMTTDGSFSVMATKYVYIHDTYIAGNAINETTGTGTSGVKYENNGFVLRYVIGV